MVLIKRICLLTLLIFCGPLTAAGRTAESGGLKALNQMIKDYSEGRLENAERRVDPEMLGRQQLMDSLNVSYSQQKQIRIQLVDTKVTSAKDVIVIRTGWEKRYLTGTPLTPKLVSGKTLFLMQLIKKEWKLSSQSGDNIFSM